MKTSKRTKPSKYEQYIPGPFYLPMTINELWKLKTLKENIAKSEKLAPLQFFFDKIKEKKKLEDGIEEEEMEKLGKLVKLLFLKVVPKSEVENSEKAKLFCKENIDCKFVAYLDKNSKFQEVVLEKFTNSKGSSNGAFYYLKPYKSFKYNIQLCIEETENEIVRCYFLRNAHKRKEGKGRRNNGGYGEEENHTLKKRKIQGKKFGKPSFPPPSSNEKGRERIFPVNPNQSLSQNLENRNHIPTKRIYPVRGAPSVSPAPIYIAGCSTHENGEMKGKKLKGKKLDWNTLSKEKHLTNPDDDEKESIRDIREKTEKRKKSILDWKSFYVENSRENVEKQKRITKKIEESDTEMSNVKDFIRDFVFDVAKCV